MSTRIHPTAVIDARAEVGDETEIGAHCVIGPGVKLGPGCRLHSHVVLTGPTTIGARNEFYPFAVIGGRSQDLKYSGEPTYLEIGDANTFREFVTVHRATAPNGKTIVGSGGNFLAYSHIAHDCIVGNDVIFSNNGTLAGHVEVGDRAIIGGLTAVHQFCRIGRLSITGGCSKIVQDVPPFMMADGNPAKIRHINQVGLERAALGKETIRAIKEAFRILYRMEMNTAPALERIRTELGGKAPEIGQLIEFVHASTRGIIR
jgi:UDP-N-acetylglucosamine acyltransferase